MGEHVVVDVSSLSQEISGYNTILSTYKSVAENCLKPLRRYCYDGVLKGAAYSNSKRYYSTTYVSILSKVVYMCDEIISLNNSILPSFANCVPDTQGLAADTEVIEEKIRELEEKNKDYQDKIDDYKRKMIPTSYLCDPPDYRAVIEWYEKLILTNCQIIIPALRKIIEGLRLFNSKCSGIYDNVNALTQQLSSILDALTSDAVWNSSSNRFVIPAQVTDAINISHYMLLSDLGESEEKDAEIIDTVFPDWNRQLEEALNSPVGVGETISDEIAVTFPNGSSVTYMISANIKSSKVSIIDINNNLTNQSIALNSSGVRISKDGISITTISSQNGNNNVKHSVGTEFDFYGRPVLKETFSTTTSLENFSVTSSVIVKQPSDMKPPKSAPKVIPIERPEPTPWIDSAWDWACDNKNSIEESLKDLGTPDPVAMTAAVLLVGLCCVGVGVMCCV